MRRSGLALATVVLLAVTTSACRDSHGGGDCCGEPLDPETSRQLGLAQGTWRDWAADELQAGAADSALVGAEADFQPQDWSLPPAFSWELTFRSTTPSPPHEVTQVLESACAFQAGARFMLGDDLSASLAVPRADGSVPALTGGACSASFAGVGDWLRYLDANPLPLEVGGLQFSAQGSRQVGVTAYVRPPDATSAVARRVGQHLCAYPGTVRYQILKTSQPSPAGQMQAVWPFVRARTCRP